MSGWEPVDGGSDDEAVNPVEAPLVTPAPRASPVIVEAPEPVVPATVPVAAQVALTVAFVILAYARLVFIADEIPADAPWRVGVRVMSEAIALLAIPAALLFSGMFSTRLSDGPRVALVAVGAALLVWPGWF